MSLLHSVVGQSECRINFLPLALYWDRGHDIPNCQGFHTIKTGRRPLADLDILKVS